MQITTPVLSPKLLALSDVLLHKSPYWSFNNYDHRVAESVRASESFLRFVEDQHKENRADGEFEGEYALLNWD